MIGHSLQIVMHVDCLTYGVSHHIVFSQLLGFYLTFTALTKLFSEMFEDNRCLEYQDEKILFCLDYLKYQLPWSKTDWNQWTISLTNICIAISINKTAFYKTIYHIEILITLSIYKCYNFIYSHIVIDDLSSCLLSLRLSWNQGMESI